MQCKIKIYLIHIGQYKLKVFDQKNILSQGLIIIVCGPPLT